MTTTIHANGSNFAGQFPDRLEALIQRLATYPLDRRFEACGDFAERLAGGVAVFFGDFLTLSAVFRIETDEAPVIAALEAAIAANKLRPDYLSQPEPFRRDRVEIRRKRFSTTQGEAELVYAGELIDLFGDDITLRDGEWRGHADDFWIEVAERWFAARRRATS